MKQKHRIKRNYIINKRFQLGCALKITAIQIPCVLVTGISLSWFYLVFMDDRMHASCNPQIFLQMLFLLFLISCGVVLFSVRLTHSIAGPVQKTGTVLRQIAKRNLPEKRIKFRKNDSFKSLADDLNHLIDSIREDHLVYANLTEKLNSIRRDIVNNNNQEQCLIKIEEILSILQKSQT